MPYPGESVNIVDLSLSEEANPRELVVKCAHILPVLNTRSLCVPHLALTRVHPLGLAIGARPVGWRVERRVQVFLALNDENVVAEMNRAAHLSLLFIFDKL